MVNLKDLTTIAVNASLLEIRTSPKPGNVHKTHNFSTTSYEDFLTVAYSSESFWNHVIAQIELDETNPSSIYVTNLLDIVEKMIKIQSGGNVLLGHYLLILPVFISAVHCFKNHNHDETYYWHYTQKIISNSDANHTVILYRALRTAQPGGMGTQDKYDLFSNDFEKELTDDKINLEQIFLLSKDYDSISKELVENYKFIREVVIPQFDRLIADYGTLKALFCNTVRSSLIRTEIENLSYDLNELILRMFLFILSKKYDTLISRKTSISRSKLVSTRAKHLWDKYNKKDRFKWMNQVEEFDQELQSLNGKLNPGTSADILACSIFIYALKEFLIR
jgi:triphosphoribosyl-dephospho-CoA synthase